MNDPIQSMTATEIQDACLNLVGYPGCAQPLYPYHNLVGLIIAKLQEWNCSFEYERIGACWWIYHNPKGVKDESLQVAFLRTAQALGHWSPPKKVEEEIEYFMNEKGQFMTIKQDPEAPCAITFFNDSPCKRVRVTPYKENL